MPWKGSSIFTKIKDIAFAIPNIPNIYSVVAGAESRMVKVEKVCPCCNSQARRIALGFTC